MMRKFLIIGCGVLTGLAMQSCKSKNSPGHAYMPDMAYSRAFETYAPYDTSKFTMDRSAWGSNEESKIYYTNQPVGGTIARGDLPAFAYANDSIGYRMSGAAKNPLDTATIDKKEAERLYLVNCGICHGTKLDGNGPLWNGGNGPYPAAPKNLMGDDMKALPEGTMYHVATYGKGQMGSYASQLTSKQRWMVISYVKGQQQGGGKVATDSMGAKTDTTGRVGKTN